MQEMLNKMVISVRQGIMGPDDASRTIHECASLLNLQLMCDLPNDTIILSGMRKTVRANDVIRTFRRFGPIDDAAVASNQKGFGKCPGRQTWCCCLIVANALHYYARDRTIPRHQDSQPSYAQVSDVRGGGARCCCPVSDTGARTIAGQEPRQTAVQS